MSRSPATPTIGSTDMVALPPSASLRSTRSPAVRYPASRQPRFACATPALVHRRSVEDTGEPVVVVWVDAIVSGCDLKSSIEFSAANVKVVAKFSGAPSLATLLTRSDARFALPPALPRSGAPAEGRGVW